MIDNTYNTWYTKFSSGMEDRKMTMTGKDFVRLLKREGWNLDRIEGSHHIMVKGNKTVSVPVHGSKELGQGLYQALLKQTGLK